MSRSERILVAVDLSDLTEKCVNEAVRFAHGAGWKVDVLLVLPGMLPTPTLGLPSAVHLLDDINRHEAHAAHERIATLLAAIPEEVRGEARIDVGDAADHIAAASEGYGMLVIATRGRTGIKHALLGSVAERVIRRAACPVMVVR